jgi:hypothetical protein
MHQYSLALGAPPPDPRQGLADSRFALVQKRARSARSAFSPKKVITSLGSAPDPRKRLILARLRLARIRRYVIPFGLTIIRTRLLHCVTVYHYPSAIYSTILLSMVTIPHATKVYASKAAHAIHRGVRRMAGTGRLEIERALGHHCRSTEHS